MVVSALSIAFLPLKCRGKKRGPSDSTFKDLAIKNLDHFSFHPALLLPAPLLVALFHEGDDSVTHVDPEYGRPVTIARREITSCYLG